MKKKIINKKKIVICTTSILLILIIMVILYIFIFKKNFIVEGTLNNTNEIVEIVNYNSKYKDNKVNVKYGNSILGYKKVKNIKLKNKIKIDTNKLHEYDLIYNVKYKSRSIEVKKKVKIVDKEKPVIDIGEIEKISVCPNNDKYNLHYSASDNYDGDVTDKVSRKLLKDKLLLEVSDSNNNKTSEEVSIERKDEEKPIITLNGKSNVNLAIGTTYNEEGATAVDNCDGDLSNKIIIDGSVDINKVGTYKITYKVSDSSNNESSISRTVRIYSINTVSSENRIIYLTFDDGPSTYTEQLLNTLKKYNVKATFFVTNQYPGYSYLVKREHEDGHTVAIHTYSHRYEQVYSSLDNYFNDLENIKNFIKDNTGIESKIVRLPGGSSNTISKNYSNGIMTSITNELTNRGYSYFDWNCSSGDAGNITSSQTVLSNVVSCMNTEKTLVVLQHDVKQFSVQAVESIIIEGLARGYTFKALTENSFNAHQRINN